MLTGKYIQVFQRVYLPEAGFINEINTRTRRVMAHEDFILLSNR